MTFHCVIDNFSKLKSICKTNVVFFSCQCEWYHLLSPLSPVCDGATTCTRYSNISCVLMSESEQANAVLIICFYPGLDLPGPHTSLLYHFHINLL